MSTYTDDLAKMGQVMLQQAKAQAGLANHTVASGSILGGMGPGGLTNTYPGTLNTPIPRSHSMLKHGDIVVSQVANGMTVMVYKGEGALPDVYVATDETLSDVIKLARVNNVLNRAK